MWRAGLLKTSVFTKEPMREMVSTLSKDSDEKPGVHGGGGAGGGRIARKKRPLKGSK